MTKGDAGRVVALLRNIYPHYYKTDESVKGAVSLWYEMFTGVEGRLVLLAMKSFLASETASFPPTVGQINNMIYSLTHEPLDTPAEAWNKVLEASKLRFWKDVIKNESEYPKKYQEAWESLSTLSKRLISPSGLAKLQRMDSTELSIAGTRFEKSYRELAEKQKNQDLIPHEVKREITEYKQNAVENPSGEIASIAEITGQYKD